jgi:hypothetical protein
MALFNHGSPPPTSAATPPSAFTGQYLAKAHLTRRQRARLAAGLTTGGAVVYPLTVKQAAFVMKLPLLDVTKARRNGKHGNGRNGHRETLAEHIARSTAEERLAAARIVGPATIWDTMISPVVSEDRAAETNVTA